MPGFAGFVGSAVSGAAGGAPGEREGRMQNGKQAQSEMNYPTGLLFCDPLMANQS